MAIIVKGEITISKGFNHWKEMIFSQKEKMAGIGMQLLFAGTTKETQRNLSQSLSLTALKRFKLLVLMRNLLKLGDKLGW